MNPNPTPPPNAGKPGLGSMPHLTALVHRYHLDETLGDGCAMRGLQTLVTMAAVLCALDTEKGLKVRNGAVLPTGLHLLITDPLVGDLVRQHIIAPLNVEQRRVLRQAQERKEASAHAAQSPYLEQKKEILENIRKAAEEKGTLFDNPLERAFGALHGSNGTEVQEFPLVLVQGADPRSIARQVARAHQGQALLFSQISRLEEVNPLEDVINALQRGNYVAPDAYYATEGTVIASVSGPVTSALFDPDIIQSTWQLRLAWLFQDKLQLPPPTTNHPGDSIHELFKNALDQILQRRLTGAVHLNFHSHDPVWSTHHNSLMQAIASSPHPEMLAYRPLLATLLKGLDLLLPDNGFPRPFSLERAIVELAKLLLKQAKAGFKYHRDRVLERKHQHLVELVYSKLGDEPLSERDIIRKCHRMPIDDCRLGLSLLEGQGRARRVEGKLWNLNPADA